MGVQEWEEGLLLLRTIIRAKRNRNIRWIGI